MAARSIEACSFHVTVSRRLSEGPNLSTYVKDTSAPAGARRYRRCKMNQAGRSELLT